MTIEEMRTEIEKYCDSCTDGCGNCPLNQGEVCYIEATDEEIKDNYELLVAKGAIKNNDVRFNSYIFDSLMYRYQLARERQLFLEVIQEHKDVEKAREQCNRDVLKFREILEEAMGEHD